MHEDQSYTNPEHTTILNFPLTMKDFGNAYFSKGKMFSEFVLVVGQAFDQMRKDKSNRGGNKHK